jgi:predicted nucleotidyltransferase
MAANLSDLIDRLRRIKPELAERFGVTGLAVFGSWVRGEQTRDSDLDLLVDFDRPPSLFALSRLDRLLESTLQIKVDTLSRDSLNPRYAPYILPELVAV